MFYCTLNCIFQSELHTTAYLNQVKLILKTVCFLNTALEYAHLSNMDLLKNLIVKLAYANIQKPI